MERDHHVDGALSRRHKELTATGISVAIDSESCMQQHIGRTIECGATLGGKP
jgi:alkylhydroperoxidase/carboxymuconolactone decarboxylase family protein YurZ